MATSSITKQFVVKDNKAFEKLLKEAEKTHERTVTAYENSSLDKGRKALKQFSLCDYGGYEGDENTNS